VPGEAFTYAALIPAGHSEHHWHSSDARVAVIQGTLKVSFGETLDLVHLKSYPVGTFLYVPANAKHTMAADVDTIIIGTAVGPWHTHHGELLALGLAIAIKKPPPQSNVLDRIIICGPVHRATLLTC